MALYLFEFDQPGLKYDYFEVPREVQMSHFFYFHEIKRCAWLQIEMVIQRKIPPVLELIADVDGPAS